MELFQGLLEFSVAEMSRCPLEDMLRCHPPRPVSFHGSKLNFMELLLGKGFGVLDRVGAGIDLKHGCSSSCIDVCLQGLQEAEKLWMAPSSLGQLFVESGKNTVDVTTIFFQRYGLCQSNKSNCLVIEVQVFPNVMCFSNETYPTCKLSDEHLYHCTTCNKVMNGLS